MQVIDEVALARFNKTMEDGSSGTNFFNAGKYAHHAVMGLCLEGMHMIRESG